MSMGGLPCSHAVYVQVGPGEVLYLPAMWYHRVSQVCSQASEGHDYVIAVNFWCEAEMPMARTCAAAGQQPFMRPCSHYACAQV